MPKASPTRAVVEFYDTHPISEQQILEKLQQDGVDLATLNEDALQNYDQDHYGGIAANDALAVRAGIDSRCHVLDVCCGLGGPARYLAHRYGCSVTGIDLTASRVEGARRLTAMVGLEDRVTVHCADALDLPFEDEAFDVVISQEAFAHIPDKDQLVRQCARVLKPGGRLAFTDILATDSTQDDTRDRLQDGMRFVELATQDEYRQRLEREGLAVEVEDLSGEWRDILSDRLSMYRGLKDQTIERFGAAHFRKWEDVYGYFVGLYETGELGGGRFLARRTDQPVDPARRVIASAT